MPAGVAKIKEGRSYQVLVKVGKDLIFCTASESVNQSSHSGKQPYST